MVRTYIDMAKADLAGWTGTIHSNEWCGVVVRMSLTAFSLLCQLSLTTAEFEAVSLAEDSQRTIIQNKNNLLALKQVGLGLSLSRLFMKRYNLRAVALVMSSDYTLHRKVWILVDHDTLSTLAGSVSLVPALHTLASPMG